MVVFGGGFLIWVGLDAAYDLVEAFTPGDWLSNYRWSPMVPVVELLRFPGLLLLWYSVLAVRVPHPREVVRATCRRLLARGAPLGVAAAASAATLGWLVASRPERAVGSVVADPLVQLLAAATALLLPVTAARRWLLARLDAWVYPETADRQQALADATAELSKADGLATVRRAVSRTAKRVCGSRATLFLPSDSSAEAFIPLDAETAALPRGSAIVHVLETVGGTMRVHPDDATSDFGMLPPEDAAWAVETDADAVVPVPGPGAELAGVLVVGPRFDGKVVRRVDVPFLETLGAAAGLVLGRLQQPGAGPLDAPPARECSTCGSLAATGDSPQCDCGSGYVETEVPKLLAGKYRLERRLGSGGMGAAYLARDLRLERNVAVKTLREGSVLRLMGLKAEARAMATAAHPAVAEIYGIESWRGRPFLVVEFLPRGTLADRLRRGPVPAPSAVAISVRLADALATLHEAGFLHGDVKPSNVGFTWNGSPKAAGLRSGARDGRPRGRRRHAAVSLAREAVGPSGGGGRRRLVAVRDAVRDGLGGASVRGARGRRRGGSGPGSVPASRRRRAARGVGLGRCGGGDRVRRVAADGPTAGTSGDGPRVRRRAPPGPPWPGLSVSSCAACSLSSARTSSYMTGTLAPRHCATGPMRAPVSSAGVPPPSGLAPGLPGQGDRRAPAGRSTCCRSRSRSPSHCSADRRILSRSRILGRRVVLPAASL